MFQQQERKEPMGEGERKRPYTQQTMTVWLRQAVYGRLTGYAATNDAERLMFYHSFMYQAGSWDRPRRVVAKVEWHCDELSPRIGHTLALPGKVSQWTLTTLREKLIKIGAKVVRHGRVVTFQKAEVAIPRQMVASILDKIAQLRLLLGTG